MNFDIKLFIMLGLVMTIAAMIVSYAQDMVLDDAVGSGEIVIGGFGIPVLYGFLTAFAFWLLWKFVLNKKVA